MPSSNEGVLSSFFITASFLVSWKTLRVRPFLNIKSALIFKKSPTEMCMWSCYLLVNFKEKFAMLQACTVELGCATLEGMLYKIAKGFTNYIVGDLQSLKMI